tara:strand:- start:42 stop:638 length:597 start_codon:yes stop_codon:yes gene_type:complete
MNDLIQVIKILNQNEVQELNSYIDTLKFEKNTVFGQSKTENPKSNPDIRTSSGTCLLEKQEITLNFHNKINQGLDEYKRRLINIHENFQYYPVPGGYDTHSWREGIQVLQYEKNQEYKFHHDVANYKEKREFYRTISVIVYLTNDFKGGGTSFPHTSFKPKPGYALIFPSNWCYPHAGEPVIEGIKRVAVTWYYVEQN